MQIPIEIRALGTSTIYLVDTDSGRYLIDTGMRTGTIDYLLDHGMVLEDLSMVILTHLHIDHTGGAMEIRRKLGTPVLIGMDDSMIIGEMKRDPEGIMDRMMGFYLSNGTRRELLLSMLESHPLVRELPSYLEMEFDLTPTGDYGIPGESDLKIMATPGHSPGSISPFIHADMIFSGDTVLPRITPNISFYLSRGNMLESYLSSLERIRSHHFNICHPGHGPSFSGTDGRIEEILEHHRRRLDEVYLIVKRGAKTALDTAMEMTWSRGRKLYDMNLHEMNFAFGEAVAHLQYLESTERIQSRVKNGITYYEISP